MIEISPVQVHCVRLEHLAQDGLGVDLRAGLAAPAEHSGEVVAGAEGDDGHGGQGLQLHVVHLGEDPADGAVAARDHDDGRRAGAPQQSAPLEGHVGRALGQVHDLRRVQEAPEGRQDALSVAAARQPVRDHDQGTPVGDGGGIDAGQVQAAPNAAPPELHLQAVGGDDQLAKPAQIAYLETHQRSILRLNKFVVHEECFVR